MTEFVFRTDSYARTLPATVAAITPEGGIVLDRTIFYATSGGQPNDTGTIEWDNGSITCSSVVHPDGDKTAIVHVPAAEGHGLQPGQGVNLSIDWDRRYRLMRMHTALHLLSVVFPFAVTGGSVGEDKGRLDFDMPDPPGDTAAIEGILNSLIQRDLAVTEDWITDDELEANPSLVKTMSVRPPTGQGRVRLIRIGEGAGQIDLQPCGGTHVARTGEIGRVEIGKIEKKGRQNRRVTITLAG
jgi:misacylated tRNA(Ala) deacylase